MNAGPSRGGAGRPEKRVTARSKAPQKKWTGLHLPTNAQRGAGQRPLDLHAGCARTGSRTAGSYARWSVSLSSRIGAGISTATGQIFTGSPISSSVDITCR